LGVVKRRLTAGLAFGLLCSGQSLTIRLYDLAKVPVGTVDRATAMAGQLLAGAGVTVIWQKGASDSLEGAITDMSAVSPTPDGREYLVVRLVRGMPAGAYAGATGYALPFAREGAHATVFYDRVAKLSLGSTVGPSAGSLLGAAMAHEIGHVLLGSGEHSVKGIMKARWGQAEFRLLACNRLQFSVENSKAIARKRSNASRNHVSGLRAAN
jgi:hypothetical protein